MSVLKARGYRFDGINDAVQLPPMALPSSASGIGWTAEAWINVDPVVAQSRPLVFPVLQLRIEPAGTLRLEQSDGVFGPSALTPAAVVTGTGWRHVALMLLGQVTSLWLDGVVVASQTIARAAGSGDPFIGGNAFGASLSGSVMVRDVRVWDRALTAAELAPFRPTLRGDEAGLAGWWPLEAGSDALDRAIRPAVTPAVSPSFRLPGAAGAVLVVPDAAILRLTNDLDIRIRVALADWTPGGSGGGLLARWKGTGNQRGYGVDLSATGFPQLNYSTNGVGTTTRSATVAVPLADGELGTLRVTLDADNGAGGHDVRFFLLNEQTGAWDQIGTTVTNAGTAFPFAASTEMVVGGWESESPYGGAGGMGGEYVSVEIRDGIDGPKVFAWSATDAADTISGLTVTPRSNGAVIPTASSVARRVLNRHGAPKNGARPALLRAVA